MHEYSIVQALLSRVAREAESRGAVRVDRLVVRIGELAGVEPDLLTSAYELFRTGTLCAEAKLDVEREAALWACPTCGQELPPGAVLRCPSCDTPARLRAGEDILLERIEMEVP